MAWKELGTSVIGMYLTGSRTYEPSLSEPNRMWRASNDISNSLQNISVALTHLRCRRFSKKSPLDTQRKNQRRAADSRSPGSFSPFSSTTMATIRGNGS